MSYRKGNLYKEKNIFEKVIVQETQKNSFHKIDFARNF